MNISLILMTIVIFFVKNATYPYLVEKSCVILSPLLCYVMQGLSQ